MNINAKKIIPVIALATVSSFAEWDYYTVLDEHQGQARIKANYWYNGDFHSTSFDLNARYTVVKGLELSLTGLGYQLFADPNDKTKEGDGFKDFSVGAKYAFNPNFSVFLDANIPAGKKEISSQEFSLKGGVQWFLPISEQFGIGNEFGLTVPFKHDGVQRGLVADYGFEFYYAFSSGVTPFTGFVFTSQLTDSKNEDKSESGTGASNISFWAGISYNVNKNVNLTLYTDIEYAAHGAYQSGYIFQTTFSF